MKRLLLLLTTFALSGVFLFVNDDTTPKSFYPFSEQKVEIDTYFYFLFEHIILVILAAVILELEPTYRFAVTVFLVIQIVDTLDYLLFYSEPWNPYMPSMNVLKVGVMGLAIAYEMRKNGKTN